MVKKIVALLMLFLVVGGANLYANKQGDPLDLEVKKIDNSPEHPGGPRTPILFPTVWQDGYDLEIEAPHAEYVLNIVSGTTVVYSVVVPETVSLVVLPATLSGTYELQLIQGNLCFYGDIDL
jgi:hypothetical protein